MFVAKLSRWQRMKFLVPLQGMSLVLTLVSALFVIYSMTTFYTRCTPIFLFPDDALNLKFRLS